GDDVATVDAGVVEDVPSDIGIVVGPSQVVRLQEGIERGVDIFSGGSGGHGVGPLLVCAFDRSFPICYYYSRMGRGCQAIVYRSVAEVCVWFTAWRLPNSSSIHRTCARHPSAIVSPLTGWDATSAIVQATWSRYSSSSGVLSLCQSVRSRMVPLLVCVSLACHTCSQSRRPTPIDRRSGCTLSRDIDN